MTDTRLHAELGASKASRWMACPGSVRMARGLPEEDTVYAAEGRAAHALAERLLKNEPAGDVDPEMLEHVNVYVSYVLCRFLHPPEGHTAILLIEQKFDLTAALDSPEPLFGTADAVIIDGRHLEVIDLKYGVGVVVHVQDNPQLLYYALGAAQGSGLGQFDTVRITIVQPRASHRDGAVRSADYTREDLERFAVILRQKAIDTTAPDAPLIAGPQCRFCPAHATCPAVRDFAVTLAQMDFTSVPIEAPPPVESLSVAVIAELLTRVPILEDWVRAMRARIERELLAGREVPGWKLVAKRPTRQWVSEADVISESYNWDVDDEQLYIRELRSPAQMEKLVGKKNVPERLYTKVSSGLTLAPSADARPAAAVGPQIEFAALPPASSAAHPGAGD